MKTISFSVPVPGERPGVGRLVVVLICLDRVEAANVGTKRGGKSSSNVPGRISLTVWPSSPTDSS